MKKEDILEDYGIAVLSRECSLMGRKEVLTGKAKFGIFGEGKEVPQVALARAFQDGDFRSGYYRDQTLMMALGVHTVENFFAGIYAHADIEADPTSAGRQMGGHFATHSLDDEGHWKDLLKQKNSSSDISCTAGQMPRLLGLAQASKVYRDLPNAESKGFSNHGNEVAWGTIGNASTSEGHFFEILNAAGVMQVPLVMSVWDDEYGISVPKEFHTIKQSISEALNQGVGLSITEYIARQDADDVWLPWHLDFLLYELEKSSQLDLIGSRVVVEEGDIPEKLHLNSHRHLSGEDLWLCLAYRNCFNHSTVIFKRSAFEDVGGYDSNFNGFEDWHLWARMVTKDNAMLLDVVTAYYRVSERYKRSMSFRARLAKSRGLRLEDVLD